ncbi:MAG: FecR domain-containing protein [Pseudomonadales bacterium]|nr:FecR domain-containing protein [Pseudomonadales bacterium]
MLIALLLIAGCETTLAPETEQAQIGVVVNTVGSPAIIRHNQDYIIDLQSKIYEGDILQTNDASRAQLQMIDGSELSVGPGSHILFQSWTAAGRGERTVPRMTLNTGSIRVDSRGSREAARSTIELRTPLAIITARASDFWSGFLFGNSTLDINLISGDAVNVSNDHGSVSIALPGEGTTILGGTGPQPANTWTPRKQARAIEETIIRERSVP